MTKDKHSWEVFFTTFKKKKLFKLLTFTTKAFATTQGSGSEPSQHTVEVSRASLGASPHTQISLTEKVSSACSYALDTSFIIIHRKFPIETEGNFSSYLQNGNFFCPKLNHMNSIRYKKAGEIIFLTTYRVENSRSSARTAVDGFWLYLLLLKLEI